MFEANQEVELNSYSEVHDALTSQELTRSINRDLYESGNIMENVLLMLAGKEHRDRRRVENQVFRRPRLKAYETDSFPKVVDETLDRYESSGKADLLDMGLLMTVILSAESAGIDFDHNSLAQREVLAQLLRVFAQGEAIDAEKGDIEQIKLQVREALSEFDRDFFSHSRGRRMEIIHAIDEGAQTEELPHDILSLLLQAQSSLGIDDGTILRETAFFFEAGAHTSTQTFTNTLHFIFDWIGGNPERRERLEQDLSAVQRCVHEALRLRPTNPRIRRRAVTEVQIGPHTIPEGAYVVLNTGSANRDPEAFGSTSEEFDPDRIVPPGIKAYGHSFGGGIHSCIGRILASGLPINSASDTPSNHLYGLVPLMVQKALRRDMQVDPHRNPEPDKGTLRWTRWISYPVIFP